MLTDKEMERIYNEWDGVWAWQHEEMLLKAQESATAKELIEEIEGIMEDVTGEDSIEQIFAFPKYKWQQIKKEYGITK